MRPLWSTSVGSPLCGVVFSRERGELLAWDALHQLHVYDRKGSCRLRRAAPAALASAAAADDGSGFAVASSTGQVWYLNPDLQPRWERRLPQPAVAVAVDSFGQIVVASASDGQLHAFDRRGRPLFQAENPRPLRHLAFVPEHPRLIGSADLGLVICYNCEGNSLWRDGLAAHVGAVAVSGDGAFLAVACFSRDLLAYAIEGPPSRTHPQPHPCRLVQLSYDGRRILAADMAGRLFLADEAGKLRDEQLLSAAPVAIAFSPLGDFAAAALPDGTLSAWDPRP